MIRSLRPNDTGNEASRLDRVYVAPPNPPLMDMVSGDVRRVLDVGCGAGGNAEYLRNRYPAAHFTGITISQKEAEVARARLDEVVVCDLERGIPVVLRDQRFDTIIFSHVLEHLRDPASVLLAFSALLASGGQILVAVPNVVNWRTRIQLARGDFTYESAGVLDSTHLRFFTYHTADAFLVPRGGPLRVERKEVTGSVPLWVLRRHLLPQRVCEAIDRLGGRLWPNLFGTQVMLRIVADNRPGGLARIRSFDHPGGGSELDGHVVRTVSYDPAGFWNIEPPQEFETFEWVRINGETIPPRSKVRVSRIANQYLEPIKDVGDEEQDESLTWGQQRNTAA